VAGCCEHGDEYSVSAKKSNFLTSRLSLVKKNAATLVSYLVS
jgi:hypothetical protein